MSRRTPTPLPVTLALAACLLAAGSPAASAQQPDSATTPPRLRNASKLIDELTENYPLPLRNAAIGGETRVRFRVDEEGKVDSAWVAFSSGLISLDRAALATARRAEFEPGRSGDAAVPMWTELPFTFRTGFERSPDPQLIPILNRSDIEAKLPSTRPRALAASSLGAMVGLSLLVDSAGRPAQIDIAHTSCLTEADEAAVAIVRQLVFQPDTEGIGARRRTHASVWFGKDSVSLRLLGDARPLPVDSASADSAAADEESSLPTRRPELSNRPHIARLLERYYPPDLRQLGIGGQVIVQFFVDEEGAVTFREVSRSSGECKLDAAALLVGREMRFEPAVSRGKRVPVWVAIPINFSSR
ncbi:MAG TPA: TonB family protein [Longimicrobiales bacterium]|nr:TonB family protein [Longimicrobiales bacterium]